MPHRNVSKELSGGEADTTNNRMEMLAVIRGVEALRRPCRIRLCSDSKYVVDGLTHCMCKWKALGWKKKRTAGRLIKNADLWQRLDEVLLPHALSAVWVRGHAGHVENERCDVLAMQAAKGFAASVAAPVPPLVVSQFPPSRAPAFPAPMDAPINYVSRTGEGGWRVDGTRVPLHLVVRAYWDGSSPEKITALFPSLSLEQVHGVLAFYLRHRLEIDADLMQQPLNQRRPMLRGD